MQIWSNIGIYNIARIKCALAHFVLIMVHIVLSLFAFPHFRSTENTISDTVSSL